MSIVVECFDFKPTEENMIVDSYIVSTQTIEFTAWYNGNKVFALTQDVLIQYDSLQELNEEIKDGWVVENNKLKEKYNKILKRRSSEEVNKPLEENWKTMVFCPECDSSNICTDFSDLGKGFISNLEGFICRDCNFAFSKEEGVFKEVSIVVENNIKISE